MTDMGNMRVGGGMRRFAPALPTLLRTDSRGLDLMALSRSPTIMAPHIVIGGHGFEASRALDYDDMVALRDWLSDAIQAHPDHASTVVA